MRLVTTAAITFGCMGLASAADLPAPTLAPAMPSAIVATPVHSWTGFYVGLSAGGAIDRYAYPYAAKYAIPGSFSGRGAITAGGPIGGAQIGFNYETPWKIVLGVEADLFAAGVSGSFSAAGPLSNGSGGVGGLNLSTRVNVLGSLRGRIGYAFDRFLFTDNVMFYFTAGGALGRITNNGLAVGPVSIAYSRTYTRSGMSGSTGTVGIGLEKALSANLSLLAEYRYQFMGAGNAVVQIPGDPVLNNGIGMSFGTRSMYHLGRIALNWKFWP